MRSARRLASRLTRDTIHHPRGTASCRARNPSCVPCARRLMMTNYGSAYGTAELLSRQPELHIVSHTKNRGYGSALITAFEYALTQDIDVLVTMDCDGQHEPSRIAVLLEAIHDADIVSGSRYLRDFRQNSVAPQDRRQINRQITAELNEILGLNLTDAFCGFKAYRREALTRLHITEKGWGM